MLQPFAPIPADATDAVRLARVGPVSRADAARGVRTANTPFKPSTAKGAASMSTITTTDGTRLFYKDWSEGQPVVFAHGWPLSSDAWDDQMLFFGQYGYRVVAHDRRSHGRSDQTWDGNNMDQYADDLAELVNKLDLKNMIMIGHSTGGGEVAHY